MVPLVRSAVIPWAAASGRLVVMSSQKPPPLIVRTTCTAGAAGEASRGREIGRHVVPKTAAVDRPNHVYSRRSRRSVARPGAQHRQSHPRIVRIHPKTLHCSAPVDAEIWLPRAPAIGGDAEPAIVRSGVNERPGSVDRRQYGATQ